MRFLSHFSMAIALATIGSLAITAVPQAAEAKKKKPKKVKPPKLSKEFAAVAGPAQKASDSLAPEAKTMVEGLLSGPWVGIEADFAGTLAINLGGKLKDTGLQEKGIVKRLEAGLMQPAETAKMQYYLGRFARGRGDFMTAETQLKAAITGGYPGPGAHLELANGYSTQKNHKASLDYLGQAIDIQNAAGTQAPEAWYRASRDRALATKDRQLYSDWAAKWADAYPSAASWGDAITAYRFKSQTDGTQNLEVLRFMKASGALVKLRDYKEFAEESNKKNNFGEVVAILNEGQSKGIVSASDPIIAEILVPTKQKMKGDKGSLPASPAAVRGSGSASVMMNFADTWLGYNEYAKAAAFYEAGVLKAGSDADRGYIGVGTSHAYAGDLVAAKTAFDKVTGARKPLANMWKTWIGQQQVAAAPAAAPASTPEA